MASPAPCAAAPERPTDHKGRARAEQELLVAISTSRAAPHSNAESIRSLAPRNGRHAPLWSAGCGYCACSRLIAGLQGPVAGRVAAIVERCGVAVLGCGDLRTPAIHGIAEGPPSRRDRAVVTAGIGTMCLACRAEGPWFSPAGTAHRHIRVEPGANPGDGVWRAAARHPSRRRCCADSRWRTRRGRGPLGLSGGIVP